MSFTEDFIKAKKRNLNLSKLFRSISTKSSIKIPKGFFPHRGAK